MQNVAGARLVIKHRSTRTSRVVATNCYATNPFAVSKSMIRFTH